MSLRKVGLLLLLLGFGAAVETAWSIRHHVDLGPAGCRVLGGKFYGPSYSFEDERVETVADGTRVEVENAFGSVLLGAGEPGRVKVGLRKVVFQPTEQEAREFAARIELDTSGMGSLLRISTNRAALTRTDDVGFETHLTIEVPPETAVVVRNEHGRVEVRDVAEADVESSYDSVRVENVRGMADLRNRHGGVQVAKVGGSLSVRARHGDVEIEDASGPLALEVQHGDVQAARVGRLTVQLAHGDLKVEGVRGDLEARAKHAAVHVANVAGNLIVETSYNEIEVADVGGEARLEAAHGAIRASSVQGALTAQASFNDVSLEEIGGPVEVTVVHGGLEARSLARGVRVKTSGDDVTIDGFRGPAQIEAQRGGVHLVPAGPLTEPLRASTTNGAIRLEVPPDSRFELEASARRGEVLVRVPGLTLTRTEAGDVTGTLAGGGSLVKLSTVGGDVTVEARSETASGTF